MLRIFMLLLCVFLNQSWATKLPSLTPTLQAAPKEPIVRDFDDLIQTLESEEGRDRFLNELKTLRSALKSSEAENEKKSLLSQHTNVLFDSLTLLKTEFFFNLKLAFQKIMSFGHHITFDNFMAFLKNGGFFGFSLMLGLALELLFKKLFLKVKNQMVFSIHKDYMRLAYFIVLKILSLLLGLGVFVITASTVLVIFRLPPDVSRALMMIFLIIAGAKGIISLSKILLNPNKPLMGIGSSLHPDLLMGIFSFIKQISLMIMISAIILYGISFSSDLSVLIPLVESIIFAGLTILVFRFMSFIQNHYKNHQLKRESWPTLIKFYVVIQTGIILVFGHQSLIEFLIKGTSTLLVLVGISLITDKFPRFFKMFLLKMREYSPTIKRREKMYMFLSRLALWILMLTTLLLCLKDIWDDSFWDWIWYSYKQKFSVMIFNLFILIVVGGILWEGSDFILTHHFQKKVQKSSKTKSLKRYETLLPLMRNTLRVVIILFIGLMIISEFGFNITPILAGASVVGIALSLGAQSLVKDFINGCFIVIENTIVLGDYVDVGGHIGTVETLTLRSLTLRDSLGGLHTVPFSTISTIVNLSKNFSRCQFLLKFNVSTSYEKVRKVLTATGKTLQENPELADSLLGDIDILGIQELDAENYTVKVHLTVAPGKQWKIERLFLDILSENLLKNKLSLFSLKHFLIFENASKTD